MKTKEEQKKFILTVLSEIKENSVRVEESIKEAREKNKEFLLLEKRDLMAILKNLAIARDNAKDVIFILEKHINRMKKEGGFREQAINLLELEKYLYFNYIEEIDSYDEVIEKYITL